MQGVPGLAKTLMVHSISDAMKLKFNRIQFTPDLMPSDITGGDVLNGAIVAIAGNSLSHWCELRRKASDADAARADPAPFPPVDDKPQSGGGNDVGPVNDRADRASASADGSPMCRVFGDSLWRMER